MSKRIILFRIIAVILSLASFLSFSIESYASSPSAYTKIVASETLNTIGDSTLKLSTDFTSDKILGITLARNNKSVSAKLKITGNSLFISPAKYLEGDSEYTIKIFTQDNKRYICQVTAIDTYEYDIHDKRFTTDWWAKGCPSLVEPTGHRILEISAKPDKGFNYPYFLLIPAGTVENKDKKFMMVAPNNTGVSDYLKVHEYMTLSNLHAGGAMIGETVEFHASTAIKTPLLVPIFPRPRNGTYTHALDRDTILIKSGDMKRLDLQLIAMIKNAKEILETRGINVENKIFMTGFSASGQFTQRFSILHPDIIKAICVGNYTCFPVKEWNKVNLPYPFGIADIEQISGQKFNESEYRKIAQFCYVGNEDPNDVIHPNSDQEKIGYEIEKSLFGDKLMVDKWIARQALVKKTGFADSIQFNTYKGIGHSFNADNIYNDIIEFFKANTGNTFTKIKAHDNAF